MGAPSARRGAPGGRHRRPPEQVLVICRGAFVVTTVKRPYARRVAFCTSFGLYSRGERQAQRGTQSAGAQQRSHM